MQFLRVIVLCLALVTGVDGKGFLGADPNRQAKMVKDELNGVLDEALGLGHGVDAARLSKMKAMLAPIFRSLPKNNEGRISASIMRYAVQRYFSEQHGWVVKGFEPHAIAANISSENSNADILQSKLPDYVRTAIEQKHAHHGFALEDLAVMVAAVERLTFDEVVSAAELAFTLRKREITDGLQFEQFMDVMKSYLITEMLEGTSSEPLQHAEDLASIEEIYPHWSTTVDLLEDLVRSDRFAKMDRRNPFTDSDVYHFHDATAIGQQISDDFASWSHHECIEMRDKLVQFDVHNTGRVKLSQFYGKSQDDGWQFGEASGYLRQIGSLDESSTLQGPQVIIPNYVFGMSNCITSAPYYSICCLNECDKVFQHLEAQILAPSASTEDIIKAVESMPDTAVIEVEKLSDTHRARLEEIATVHNGQVPLHGRLFAQWLHYVFPRDCPFPHLVGTVNPVTPVQYDNIHGQDSVSATDEEVEQWLKSEAAKVVPAADAGAAMWNLKEHILDHSTPSDRVESPLRNAMRILAFVGFLAAFAALLFKHLIFLISGVSGRGSGKVEQYDV